MAKIENKYGHLTLTFLLALVLSAVVLLSFPQQSQAQQFVPGGPNCPEGTERVRSATGETFCIIGSTFSPQPQSCPPGFAPVRLIGPTGNVNFACALLEEPTLPEPSTQSASVVINGDNNEASVEQSIEQSAFSPSVSTECHQQAPAGIQHCPASVEIGDGNSSIQRVE